MSNLERIILECSKNSRKAQLELYEHYAPMLLGICIRYVEDKSEAEDILQESFIKIFKNIKEYSGKGHFENWMRKIVINTAITHFHKEKKHYYHEEIDNIPEDNIQLDISPNDKIETEELYQLLKTLPEGYKMIFNLYAIEGYKHKEIAEMMHIEESTSKTQYLRAKNWLIKEMKKLNWA